MAPQSSLYWPSWAAGWLQFDLKKGWLATLSSDLALESRRTEKQIAMGALMAGRMTGIAK
jgi:exonuclease III